MQYPPLPFFCSGLLWPSFLPFSGRARAAASLLTPVLRGVRPVRMWIAAASVGMFVSPPSLPVYLSICLLQALLTPRFFSREHQQDLKQNCMIDTNLMLQYILTRIASVSANSYFQLALHVPLGTQPNVFTLGFNAVFRTWLLPVWPMKRRADTILRNIGEQTALRS